MASQIIQIPSILLTKPEETMYRVHYADDLFKGIYRERGIALDLMDDLDGRHPLPSTDKDLGWREMSWEDQPAYIFGFKNLDQLKFWIYKQQWIDALTQAGCVISRLTARKAYVNHGRTQAIMVSDKIQTQSYIPWTALDK